MWNFTLERHKSLDHVQRAEVDGSESEHSLPVAVDQLWHVLLTHLYPAILLHVVHWDKHTNKTDMNTQTRTVFAKSIFLLRMLCFYLNVWDMTGNERREKERQEVVYPKAQFSFSLFFLWLISLLCLFFSLFCTLVCTCVVSCCQRGCMCWDYNVDLLGLFHFIIINIIYVFILNVC